MIFTPDFAKNNVFFHWQKGWYIEISLMLIIHTSKMQLIIGGIFTNMILFLHYLLQIFRKENGGQCVCVSFDKTVGIYCDWLVYYNQTTKTSELWILISLLLCLLQVDRATGRFNGQFKTYAICGAIRRMVCMFTHT